MASKELVALLPPEHDAHAPAKTMHWGRAAVPHLRHGQSRDMTCMQSYAVGSYCSSSSSPTSSTPESQEPRLEY